MMYAIYNKLIHGVTRVDPSSMHFGTLGVQHFERVHVSFNSLHMEDSIIDIASSTIDFSTISFNGREHARKLSRIISDCVH